MKHLLNEKVDRVLDKETGELVEQTESKTWVVSGPGEEFFQVYTQVLGIICGIKQFAAVKVLCKFLEKVDFNNNIVEVSKAGKQKICQELGISTPTYYNAINQLKELKLISGEGGMFTVEPELIWKGTIARRKELLTAGCKITIAPSGSCSQLGHNLEELQEAYNQA